MILHVGVISAAAGAAVVAAAALDETPPSAGRHISADGDIPW